MSKFNWNEIKGVIPAMLTSFNMDEAVDEQAMRRHTRFLIESGVDGLYITGSTGLCFTMTLEERMQAAEIIINEVQGRIPVIVHVGDIGTVKSIKLAQHAEKIGADAISSVPPFYWNFKADNIYQYYHDVSQSVDIPMIVYNIQLAGLMNRQLLEKLTEIPNIRGLKYTSRQHDELGSLKGKYGDRLTIYSGCDEMAYSGLSFGADGIIGSFYNVIPELYIKLVQEVANGNMKEAMACQRLADEFIFTCLNYDFPTCLYYLLRCRGIDAGFARRPFLYDEEGFGRMKQELKTLIEPYRGTAPVETLEVFDFS